MDQGSPTIPSYMQIIAADVLGDVPKRSCFHRWRFSLVIFTIMAVICTSLGYYNYEYATDQIQRLQTKFFARNQNDDDDFNTSARGRQSRHDIDASLAGYPNFLVGIDKRFLNGIVRHAPEGTLLDMLTRDPTSTILAFGDSLTEGYERTNRGVKFHPYTIHLNAKLMHHYFKSNAVESGLSGERTTSMIPRLKEALKDNLWSNGQMQSQVRLTIILGGTNDLGKSMRHEPHWSAQDTIARLTELYNIALEGSGDYEISPALREGIASDVDAPHRPKPKPKNIEPLEPYNHTHANINFVLALTIPKNPGQDRDELNQMRSEINNFIRSYVDKCSNRMVLLDMEDMWYPITKNVNKYWSDGIHYSNTGYDLIGEMIWEKLISTRIDKDATTCGVIDPTLPPILDAKDEKMKKKWWQSIKDGSKPASIEER
jgi:lysophospholipase L1-like esterase